MNSEEIGVYIGKRKELLTVHGLNILVALVVLFIGLRIIKTFSRYFRSLMDRRNVDLSLIPFPHSILITLLKIVLVVSMIQMVGIETTSFVALRIAAGLAVVLAISGTLQNFVGGVVLLLLKPFKVRDFNQAQGRSGSVNAIQIFYTILQSPVNKTIIRLNDALSSGSLINHATEKRRRVDREFGVSSVANIDHVKSVLNRLNEEETHVITDPAPAIVLSTLSDSSINFQVRIWSLASDYCGIFFDFHEKVKKAFDAVIVSIPFPQMDLHIQKEK